MSSSAGENGTGVCGAVTILIGPSEASKASSRHEPRESRRQSSNADWLRRRRPDGRSSRRSRMTVSHVDRRQRSQIDDLTFDAVLPSGVGCLIERCTVWPKRRSSHACPRARVRFAERYRVVALVGHIGCLVVHQLCARRRSPDRRPELTGSSAPWRRTAMTAARP